MNPKDLEKMSEDLQAHREELAGLVAHDPPPIVAPMLARAARMLADIEGILLVAAADLRLLPERSQL